MACPLCVGAPCRLFLPSPSAACPPFAGGTELPILPVMPGRINAITASAGAASAAAAPTPPPAATASYSGSGDSGSERRRRSPSLSPAPDGGAGQPQRSRTSSAMVPPPRGSAAKPSYAPSGRTQQLLRLLELNEQLAASAAGAAGGGAAPDGAAASSASAQALRHQPAAALAAGMERQASVKRVPSATAALDTLALLAEAEAESDAGEPAHSAHARLVPAF